MLQDFKKLRLLQKTLALLLRSKIGKVQQLNGNNATGEVEVRPLVDTSKSATVQGCGNAVVPNLFADVFVFEFHGPSL